jgi:dTDP-4-dehydrorhamnose 3,5-epimerase
MCAVADVRPDSSTFGAVETFLLGDEPGAMHRIFVCRGLANAFFCLTEVDYLNDVSEEYDPSDRGGVIWDDPTLAVAWPTADPILSSTDQKLPTLKAKFPDHPLFAG